MQIIAATESDLDETLSCLADAFAKDPITGYLMQNGPGYRERVAKFFSLLMRARLALGMPVLVAKDESAIQGAVMGYTTLRPTWPKDLAEEWDRFEHSIPGLPERMAVYERLAEHGKPATPHYYLGVIGTDPKLHGRGIGTQLIKSFCEISAGDGLSSGVYLETAQESNVSFYKRAGFVETHRGGMGDGTLWCMFLKHEGRSQ